MNFISLLILFFLSQPQLSADPIISGDTIVCLGHTLELEVQFINGATYEWQNPAGETVSVVHSLSIPDMQFDQAGMYTVTINHESCPNPAAVVEIQVADPPTAPLITDNAPVCAGQNLELSTPELPNAAYLWLDPFGNILSETHTATVENIQESQAGIYTLEVTRYGCTSPQSFTEAEILSGQSAPVLTAEQEVCPGDTIRIFAPEISGAEYFWEGPGDFSSPAVGEVVIHGVTEENAGIYGLIIAADGCISPVGTIEISILPAVGGTWTEDVQVCAGLSAEAEVVLTGVAPFEVFFSEGENGSIAELVNESTGAVTLFPTGTTEYSLNRVIDANGCEWEGEENLQVTVLNNPAIANFSDEVCNSINTEYLVQFDMVGGTPPYHVVGTLGLVNEEQFISELLPSGSEYVFQVRDANDCRSDFINGFHTCACETSAGAIDQTPLRYCTNENAVVHPAVAPTLDSDDVFYYILHDVIPFQSGNILSEFDTPFFEFLPGMNAGQTYYVTAVAGTDDGTGKVNFSDVCADVSGTVEVIFTEQPAAPEIHGPTNLCPGDFLALETQLYAGEGEISYVWTTPNSVFTTAGPDLFIEDFAFNNAGNYSVEIEINGCRSPESAAFAVSVNEAGAPAQTAADTVLCGGSELLLTANLPENTTGIWTTDSDIEVPQAESPIVRITDLSPGEAVFYWSLSTADCPSYSADSLVVRTEAAAPAEDDFYTLAEDETFLEIAPFANDAGRENPTRFVTVTAPPTAGQLSPLDADIFEFKRPLCFAGQVEFTYAACTVTGLCPMLCDTAVVTIEVLTDPRNSYLFLPDGITANGDGLNDYWVIEGIEKYQNSELVIVNQAGQVIFSEKPYTNSWNGEYRGKKLPEGAYYYILKTDAVSKEILKGRVYLFR